MNIAHRGASGDFPENTLYAFDAAIRAGAVMCELDVQLSADGVLVVIHDDDVSRTTDGIGEVRNLTFDALRRLDAGRWFDPRFAGERIPSLCEVFDLAQGRCALNVELKADGVAEPVCALIHEHDAEESTLVSSFDWNAIAEVRRIAPAVRTALLTSRGVKRTLETARVMGVAAMNPRYGLVDQALCEEAHRQGLKVYTWTVDDPATMGRLLEAGIDGIMTNYPARLQALLDA